MSGASPAMPTTDELLAAVAIQLSGAITPSLTSNSQANDAYELYLFSLVVRAARDMRARVRYETVHGTRATRLTVRTTPGRIYSRAYPYSHAVLEWAGRPTLEVHIGVRVRGRSNVLHECDVAVIDRNEAQRCRSDNTDPRSSKLVTIQVPVVRG